MLISMVLQDGWLKVGVDVVGEDDLDESPDDKGRAPMTTGEA